MTDKAREDFEAWFKRQKDSEYCSPNVKAFSFDAWQASRAALVVELKTIEGSVDKSDYSDGVGKLTSRLEGLH